MFEYCNDCVLEASCSKHHINISMVKEKSYAHNTNLFGAKKISRSRKKVVVLVAFSNVNQLIFANNLQELIEMHYYQTFYKINYDPGGQRGFLTKRFLANL